MATAYTDTACQVAFIQDRTDAAASAVDDASGEDARLINSLYTEGVVGADDWKVAEQAAGADMTVDVGSGVADTDMAFVVGVNSGQGSYLVRMEAALVDVTINAADASNPRIDEIYLVLLDDGYDSTTFGLPRIGYRDGTPAPSPSAPGPDGAWDAFLLLATIAVAANETEITDAEITDERVFTLPVIIDGPQIGSDSETATDSTLDTTFEDGATVAFTMPANWNTYQMVAWGTAQLAANGGTSPVGEVRIGIGGDFGDAQKGGATIADGVGTTTTPVANHERTGLTGDVTVVVQYRETTASLFKEGSTVNFIAVRTS